MASFSIGTAELKKVVQQLEPMFKGGFDNLPRILFDINDKITASSTNGEAYSKIIFECDISEKGKFVVPGSLFAKIVKQSNSEKIEVSTKNDNKLSVVCGKVNYEIVLLEMHEQYFEAPVLEQNQNFVINSQDLKTAINNVSCCIDIAKQHLACVMIHSNPDEKNKIYIVATDGMRLGVADKKAVFENDIPNLMIPKKAAEYIVSMIGETNCDLTINYNSNMIEVSNGNIFYTTKLLDTAFPKYQSVIPTQNNKILETNVSDIKDVIKSISNVSEITFRIKMVISADKIDISCEDNGNISQASIDATYSDTKNIEIVCNFKLLTEILDKISSSIVRFQIMDSSTPILIKPLDSDDIKYVFMPFVS